MADARELIAETRAQLKAVEDKLFAHPYLSAVEEGGSPKRTSASSPASNTTSSTRTCAASHC